jgi:tRNA G18 (ribose-2'-O)-methylase SpoU
MLNIRHVTSLDYEDLAPYRTLRRPQDHIQQGMFVAEGEKVVRRLVESGLDVVSMLMTPRWYQLLVADLQKSIAPLVTIYIAEKEILQTIVGFPLHQGIMAVGKVPEEPHLDDVLRLAPSPQLLVALDGLVNAENVGVLVRNCAAFGVDAILVGQNSSSPFLRRSVRNSMGAVFIMPIIHSADLARSLKELSEKNGIRIILANPSDGRSVETADLSGNLCIVFGNEGTGLSREILQVPASRIAIPMKNNTDSLNVASASAVLLYEASRNKKKATKGSDLIDTAAWNSDPS